MRFHRRILHLLRFNIGNLRSSVFVLYYCLLKDNVVLDCFVKRKSNVLDFFDTYIFQEQFHPSLNFGYLHGSPLLTNLNLRQTNCQSLGILSNYPAVQAFASAYSVNALLAGW